ncbi:hypothetical protein NSK_007417 [Nannochloropsis salina CCMP1776]|uniref:Uncharacterized protein n=1 Tax=Nannochloropsis salina CCMP1776 TaxID=1027361 RepID=A0A4D9CRM9_9STRA|nr:hypothetical protein NSK_007417 [Nannochloropsis salina CCMP1776]|eukprot:TFJ81456.1 hypothetical protein NSK_007417 [Nannochloropsis salina CCMP1776]
MANKKSSSSSSSLNRKGNGVAHVREEEDDDKTLTPSQQEERHWVGGNGVKKEVSSPTCSSSSSSSFPVSSSGATVDEGSAGGRRRLRSSLGSTSKTVEEEVLKEEEEEEDEEKEERKGKAKETPERRAARDAASRGEVAAGRKSQEGARKASMRRVAEKRAAFFARADAQDRVVPGGEGGGRGEGGAEGGAEGGREGGRSLRSSLPMPLLEGRRKKGKEEEGEGKEEWCGPFATARRMLREREEARAARLARLEGGQVEEEEEEGEEGGGEGGVKDKGRKRRKVVVEWEPVGRKKRPLSFEPLALSTQCLNLLLMHVEGLEGLGEVSTQGHPARRSGGREGGREGGWALAHIGNHCTALRELDVGGLLRVDEEALQVVLGLYLCMALFLTQPATRSLTRVILARSAVTDDVLEALLQTAGSTLKFLDVNSNGTEGEGSE